MPVGSLSHANATRVSHVTLLHDARNASRYPFRTLSTLRSGAQVAKVRLARSQPASQWDDYAPKPTPTFEPHLHGLRGGGHPDPSQGAAVDALSKPYDLDVTL
jgi:hypothetical protein